MDSVSFVQRGDRAKIIGGVGKNFQTVLNYIFTDVQGSERRIREGGSLAGNCFPY